MQFLDIRRVIEEIGSEELGLSPDHIAIEFVHRSHTDVYRIRSEGQTFIALASSSARAYLKRLRENLQRLESLDEPGIPRMAAWRAAPAGALPGREWAVLVYHEMPGKELSPRNFSAQVWANVCRILQRIHSLEADREATTASALRGEDPAAFTAFGESLLIRLSDLPLRANRVRQHVDEMQAYVTDHATSFHIPSRLIHADLDRSNVVVDGPRASILDWVSMGPGDYAFDLAMLKFMLDSVAPRHSAELIQNLARTYRSRLQDDSLETRLRFFLALAGLIHAFWCADDTRAFAGARAWRVRAAYLHSEAQWRSPLHLDGDSIGAPAVRTEQWALDVRQPFRGLFYMVGPKRVG